jgi:hypothetical protein
LVALINSFIKVDVSPTISAGTLKRAKNGTRKGEDIKIWEGRRRGDKRKTCFFFLPYGQIIVTAMSRLYFEHRDK